MDIIVLTNTNFSQFRVCLDSILQRTNQPVTVLDCSGDEKSKTLKAFFLKTTKYSNLKIVDCGKVKFAEALNQNIPNCQNDNILVFTDEIFTNHPIPNMEFENVTSIQLYNKKNELESCGMKVWASVLCPSTEDIESANSKCFGFNRKNVTKFDVEERSFEEAVFRFSYGKTTKVDYGVVNLAQPIQPFLVKLKNEESQTFTGDTFTFSGETFVFQNEEVQRECTKTLCLFSSFSEESMLHPNLKVYLKMLADNIDDVIFITNQRPFIDIQFLKQNNIKFSFVKNEGFDFGMWSKGLALIENLGDYSDLLLANDSVFIHKDLKPYIDHFKASNVQVQSFTENDEVSYHLQSYFLWFKSDVFPLLKQHFKQTPLAKNFAEAIHKHEIGLSKFLLDKNVKLQPYYINSKSKENPTIFGIDDLLKRGCPFIKRKTYLHSFKDNEKVDLARRGYVPFDKTKLKLL